MDLMLCYAGRVNDTALVLLEFGPYMRQAILLPNETSPQHFTSVRRSSHSSSMRSKS